MPWKELWMGSGSAVLWMDSSRTRFFAIPEEASLPSGDLVLHDARGTHRAVEALAADVYAISRADAEALARARLADAVGAARDAFRPLLDLAGTGAAAPDNPVGEDLDALLRDPERVRARLEAVLTELAAGFKAGLAAKPAPPSTAPPAAPLHELGGKVRTALASPELGAAIRGLGAAFTTFGDELERQVARASERASAAAQEDAPATPKEPGDG
jgi:hypothetical protein